MTFRAPPCMCVLCAFHVRKFRCAKRKAQDTVDLRKRPCDKISVKYVTPKVSFLIECDDYIQK